MELKTLILWHFLVVSLAINAGLLYRGYSSGNTGKFQDDFGLENSTKNSSLATKRETHFADSNLIQIEAALSPPAVAAAEAQVIDLDQLLKLTSPSKPWNSHGSCSTAKTQFRPLMAGDPKMYEQYWRALGDRTTVVIPGWKFISYFSDVTNLCWFVEPEFAAAVIRLHQMVGNAVTDNRHIVVGTGSTQLYQAVLYAVAPTDSMEPIDVVSAAPFYSSYPLITDFLKSGLYKWSGCANKFNVDKPYIELVTSPNNPDGASREAVVANGEQGILVHDLAYYWPQYAPISHAADHDIMLFTVSKSTGHAGTRLGWALVKDPEIAKKMTEFIILSTIGVSKESQYRAAKIIQVLCDTHQQGGQQQQHEVVPFFEHSYHLMARRWEHLRQVVEKSKLFSLPDFPRGLCTFSGRSFATQPAFAWLQCNGEIEDCESFLRQHKIITRGGKHFGESEKYVRISTLHTDEVFEQFTQRLSSITSNSSSLLS